VDAERAKLFFELIAQRYERKSIILTSNRVFNEWDKIFTDEVIATAILDRLLHHNSKYKGEELQAEREEERRIDEGERVNGKERRQC